MTRDNLLTIAAAALCVGVTGALANDAARPHAVVSPAAHMSASAPAPAAPPVVNQTPMALQAARAVLDGVGVESGARLTKVQSAVNTLAANVKRQSDPNALKLAVQAYYSYKTAHPEQVRKPYLYFVDYGLDSRTPRGYVFDMQALKVVEGPFMVAHGRGSAAPSEGRPTRFSNRNGSNATSLGLYLAQETYNFTGKTAGQRYSSVGLRLKGLSGSYNSKARARGVVAHGAPYVTASRAGRSEGCPAVEPARAQRILPKIANGGLVFLFSPLDRTWMRQDPWANGDLGALDQLASAE
ncbi:murein L,D-transpeptidase catalytic domain-containing protein [Longimicrobium terrae]|uniref:Murein L,D-transpeptidase catalytic domain family protein n=1 Tax=Longimicrobium terrae TaxID=1639882 RepID=A0A841GQQ3_9BACT|nr:murein L,D-transpeptidase catalytic domain family protein [Longimicrobium terrae]MBB4635458.1 hypothetical protein [Longimicrobium terrae]MBB6069852.1 hypothetical protein [Longimicrobium terrae]NNC30944.1 hypothetical protein [Longimicrobium terrae]NNC32770.1 hypothetical protein [Longimicrobium terrae]